MNCSIIFVKTINNGYRKRSLGVCPTVFYLLRNSAGVVVPKRHKD